MALKEFPELFGYKIQQIYVSIGLWDIRSYGPWMAGETLSQEQSNSLSSKFASNLGKLISYIQGLVGTKPPSEVWLRTTLRFTANGAAIDVINAEIRRNGAPYYDFDYDVRSAVAFNRSCNVLRDDIHPLPHWAIQGGLKILGLSRNTLERHYNSKPKALEWKNFSITCRTPPKG